MERVLRGEGPSVGCGVEDQGVGVRTTSMSAEDGLGVGEDVR